MIDNLREHHKEKFSIIFKKYSRMEQKFQNFSLLKKTEENDLLEDEEEEDRKLIINIELEYLNVLDDFVD